MSNALGLYVHIPFCRSRCGYCDFATAVRPQAEWDVYLDRLVKEIQEWGRLEKGRRVHSVFLGGGTPSLIGRGRIGRLLNEIGKSFPLDKDTEITLEANPDSVSVQLLAHLRQLGVNRLSLGVQSWQPALLARLDRCHSADQARKAFEWAKEAGYDNISLDLIYGIPGQTVTDWMADIKKTLQLGPEHLSLYELTLEPWTPLGRQVSRGDIRLPPEEVVIRMYEEAEELLTRAGYRHYEISNYARPGRQCVHNRQTWRQGEFLGFGLSASSHWQGKRFRNPERWTAYVESRTVSGEEAPGVHDVRWLNSAEKWSEGLILGLRLLEGVNLVELENRVGPSLPSGLDEVLEKYEKSGLVVRQGKQMCLSKQGRLLSDMIFTDLVTGAEY
jgi:oxygen-independent coproporphyrinogen III oxidase